MKNPKTEFETGVPLPASRRVRRGKYSLPDMPVWGTLWRALPEGYYLRNCASKLHIANPEWCYTSAVEVDENGVKGIRVWRTA